MSGSPAVDTTLPRLPRLVLGLVLCGVAIAMMVEADLGLGPWDVLHQGVAGRTRLTIGAASILTGVVVLAAWVPLRERPGIGTVLNVLIIGMTLDLALALMPDPEGLALRWALLLASTPVFAIGSGLYIGVDLGSGPRDGMMTGLARRGVPVGVARAAIELSALALGWLLGGTVGIGTLYFALSIGPLVHVALPRLRMSGLAVRH
jgi:uncharacterized membrane protein YczE